MATIIIDDRTPGEQFKLPHPQNRLEADVLRLREALVAIDLTLQELATTAALTTAINNLQSSLNGLSSSINTLQQNKVGVINSKPGPDVTLTPSDIGALGLGQYGFGAQELPTPVADLNLATERTQVFMGSAMANAPSAGFYMVFQLVRGTGWVTQLAFGLTDYAGSVFMRTKLNGAWAARWREISGRLPTGYVDDSTGSMYAAASGGLNMSNVWRYAGAIEKRAPNPDTDGDVFQIIITNGQLDNKLWACLDGTKVMGQTDYVRLDLPGPYDFKYFKTLGDWRLV